MSVKDTITNARHGATLVREMKMAITLSPEDIAAAFCEMDHDRQAEFFVEVARIMKAWEIPGAASMQTLHMGIALRGEFGLEARRMLDDVLETAAEPPESEPPEPDGEAFRGTQAADYEREQLEAARRLK